MVREPAHWRSTNAQLTLNWGFSDRPTVTNDLADALGCVDRERQPEVGKGKAVVMGVRESGEGGENEGGKDK